MKRDREKAMFARLSNRSPRKKSVMFWDKNLIGMKRGGVGVAPHSGDCANFAEALRNVWGAGRLVGVFPYKYCQENEEPTHVVLKVGKTLWDASGKRTKKELKTRYVDEESPNDFVFIEFEPYEDGFGYRGIRDPEQVKRIREYLAKKVSPRYSERDVHEFLSAERKVGKSLKYSSYSSNGGVVSGEWTLEGGAVAFESVGADLFDFWGEAVTYCIKDENYWDKLFEDKVGKGAYINEVHDHIDYLEEADEVPVDDQHIHFKVKNVPRKDVEATLTRLSDFINSVNVLHCTDFSPKKISFYDDSVSGGNKE